MLLCPILIYNRNVLSQLGQFWEIFQTELANKEFYKANNVGIRLRLIELQESDKKARKIKIKDLDKYKEGNKVLHYQKLLFLSKIIQTKFISRHHNNFLVDYFEINKTKELVGLKDY